MTSRQPARNHVFYEVTRSLCPECGLVIDAQVLIREGAVYLRKNCPQHGWHEALVSSDADWYVKSLKYNKPGALPYDFSTSVARGCPDDCGLCPEHQQHTCIGIIEITSRCNMTCPMCFADAGSGHDMGLADVKRILDRLIETEGEPEIVQISGGEPTLHAQILDILAMVKERGIRHVTLNTNGLRLAREPEFVRQIAPYKPTVYLQFDGLRGATYQALRGQDLAALKLQALDNAANEGLHAVLVPTLVRGINEDEIGDIVRFGLEHPAVVGINYQPATFAGRCLDHLDPLRRTTVPDVLHALETQTDGLFRVSDFLPVPCPHPTCSACTYAVIHDGQVSPIPRLVDVDGYLDYVTNRSLPDLSEELKPVLEALWSFAAVAGSEKTNAALNSVACGCGIERASQFRLSPENFFMIQVHGFMDKQSFDLKRLMKCCVHELLPDGRAVPFCAYNLLGYRDQIRREREVSIVGQE